MAVASNRLSLIFIRRGDKTNPTDGGWGAVLNWLIRNPPKSRIPRYFDGGLFADDLSAKQCDVMLFQMDVDILSDCIFQEWAKKNLGYEVVDSEDPIQRGSEIRSIVEIAGDFVELAIRDSKRHIRRRRSNRRRPGASPPFVCCPVIPRC